MKKGILEENCLTEYNALQPCANAVSEVSLFLMLFLENAMDDRLFIMTLTFVTLKDVLDWIRSESSFPVSAGHIPR